MRGRTSGASKWLASLRSMSRMRSTSLSAAMSGPWRSIQEKTGSSASTASSSPRPKSRLLRSRGSKRTPWNVVSERGWSWSSAVCRSGREADAGPGGASQQRAAQHARRHLEVDDDSGHVDQRRHERARRRPPGRCPSACSTMRQHRARERAPQHHADERDPDRDRDAAASAARRSGETRDQSVMRRKPDAGPGCRPAPARTGPRAS